MPRAPGGAGTVGVLGPATGPVAHWARPAERAGWAGPRPAGRSWGGGHRRGCPPPLFSLPATAAANHLAGARPRRGPPQPRNSQTPSFRGKKIRAAGSAAGRGGRPGALGLTHISAGSGPRTRLHRHLQPGQERKQARVDRGSWRGKWRGGLGCHAGPGRGPGAPGAETLQTFRSCPGRTAFTGARGLPCMRSQLCPCPWEWSPTAQASTTASGTSREPRWGRPAWVGVRTASCGGGCQAPRLRAGRPAIQLSRPSPISRALSSPGTSEPMGSERGGAAGRKGANKRGGSSEGGRDLARGALWPVPAVGVGVGSLAWPAPAGGRTRGAPGSEVRVRGTRAGARGGGGAEVSCATRAGAAGTGRPVAMATAGPARGARPGGGGGCGHRESGARGSRAGSFHLLHPLS